MAAERPPFRGYQVPEVRLAAQSSRRGSYAKPTAAGFAVEVWTVDDEADMDRLLSWGADGLISNRPDLAVAVRDTFLQGRSGS